MSTKIDMIPEKIEIFFIIFSSFKVYPRPDISFLSNFFKFKISICLLIDARDMKKNIEKDINQIEANIFITKPPAIILKVYKAESIKRSIKTYFLNMKVYKFEIIKYETIIKKKFLFVVSKKGILKNKRIRTNNLHCLRDIKPAARGLNFLYGCFLSELISTISFTT